MIFHRSTHKRFLFHGQLNGQIASLKHVKNLWAFLHGNINCTGNLSIKYTLEKIVDKAAQPESIACVILSLPEKDLRGIKLFIRDIKLFAYP